MKKIVLVFLISAVYSSYFSQNSSNEAQIHGNVQTDVQFYNPDSLIGATAVPEKMLMNGFANINFTKGDFSAGIRYESYLNALQGFPAGYRGTGIGYRFASYKLDKIEVTAGNFYEQFGSGMVLRAYEERGLGYDNALDGFRIKYNPYRGVYLKGIYGKQRLFFEKGPGIVRGIDGEVVINELSDSLDKMKTRIILGGSFVSKYQEDDNQALELPQNVGSYAGRINIYRGPIAFNGEYVEKINDPSADNNFIYKKGQALLLNAAYSVKGFGASFSAKSIDNMSYRSDRNQGQTNVFINYLPTTSKQHTYNLPATLYPYAVQPNGEVAYQGDVSYKVKKKKKRNPDGSLDKKSFNWRKYNTYISVNYSTAHALDSSRVENDSLTRQGYTTNFFAPGKRVYFSDFNIEIKRKLSPKARFIYTYYNMRYDKDVIEGKTGTGVVNAQIHVLDFTYKLNSKNTVRMEAQHLGVNKKDGFYKDQGNWATGLIEYTISPGWFFALLDQYNYGNDEEVKKIHYLYGSVGYIHKTNRFTLSYGRQRAGIFCVGGVCRVVPASNGISFSLTSTF
ncbi:MAG: hypothetical protein ACI8RY_000880 [Urechidicola sp.]|jgi:hypothetical protein|tara:strand:- start:1388 stop:3079 length:1692 start_codon:yes stop_codon:yes gene_type:complete